MNSSWECMQFLEVDDVKRQHTQDSDLLLDPSSPKTTNTRPKNETSQSQADSRYFSAVFC